MCANVNIRNGFIACRALCPICLRARLRGRSSHRIGDFLFSVSDLRHPRQFLSTALERGPLQVMARGRLLPGRFATVEIRMHEIPDAIAVPTEAIVPEMGIDKVFLYRNGKAHAVEVTTGLRTESSIQIINGLNVGDTLITSGTLQLREGLPVRLDNLDTPDNPA